VIDKTSRSETPPAKPAEGRLVKWLSALAWGVAIAVVALAALIVYQSTPAAAASSPAVVQNTSAEIPESSGEIADLPAFSAAVTIPSVFRTTSLHTIIPTRSREEVSEYTVQKGDSIFSISNKYGLKPDTILWANYDILNDNPDMLSVGQNLVIPPVDGVLHKWQDGDTIESVAASYKTTPEKILLWPTNNLEMENPKVESGSLVMVPDGKREFRQWVVATVWRPSAGATKTISDQCTISGAGAYGTGAFVWPAGNHFLSGNDYWDGHLGIDIAAGLGAPIYAADSGVVVHAGPIAGGYGNMVMIDHGNGYHTVYAHLSQVNVRCGQSVLKGNTIGLAGSTGNSTGPHLHFEVRFMGGFVNPWYVLP
jgi:murein DD-endopeptidase MepM/ murein hydrolase activator NlpD